MSYIDPICPNCNVALLEQHKEQFHWLKCRFCAFSITKKDHSINCKNRELEQIKYCIECKNTILSNNKTHCYDCEKHK